ncbi:hypothetical protein ACVIQT_005872 [Bradyrhizobium diazoefficiens]
MSWKKKYAIGCLIALFVFTAMDRAGPANSDSSLSGFSA